MINVNLTLLSLSCSFFMAVKPNVMATVGKVDPAVVATKRLTFELLTLMAAVHAKNDAMLRLAS
ncbi:hypothetical protein DD237_005768 [Peronospora effusa]|uniref:Uncharacterized protein n=1 Tax=Peronospora effusa TaxID=542832 RepID=A0A3R7XVA9_9STRA|nr:hypothetical protein DD237_005768 [Peronospora effusa]